MQRAREAIGWAVSSPAALLEMQNKTLKTVLRKSMQAPALTDAPCARLRMVALGEVPANRSFLPMNRSPQTAE